MGGAARRTAFERVRRPGRACAAVPGAAPHDVRAALGDVARLDVRALPDADAVARGWDVQLERGLQAELPPPIGETRRRGARRSAPRAARRRDVVAALEDWGFDDEAADGWAQLGWPGGAGPAGATAVERAVAATRRGRRPRRARAVLVEPPTRCSCASGRRAVDLPPGLPAGVARSVAHRWMLPLRRGRAVVRGALARRAPGAALGIAARGRAAGSGARPGVVVDASLPVRRCSPSRRARCCRWVPATIAGDAVDAPGQFS